MTSANINLANIQCHHHSFTAVCLQTAMLQQAITDMQLHPFPGPQVRFQTRADATAYKLLIAGREQKSPIHVFPVGVDTCDTIIGLGVANHNWGTN